ncbi:26984_t:CDS:2, partial [Racocetra persica]
MAAQGLVVCGPVPTNNIVAPSSICRTTCPVNSPVTTSAPQIPYIIQPVSFKVPTTVSPVINSPVKQTVKIHHPPERSRPTVAARKHESGHKRDNNISCVHELSDGLKVPLRNAQALRDLENGGQNRVRVEKDVHTESDSDQALFDSRREPCKGEHKSYKWRLKLVVKDADKKNGLLCCNKTGIGAEKNKYEAFKESEGYAEILIMKDMFNKNE